MSGRIHSIPAETTESFVESIDRVETSNVPTIVFISRYPASRLIDLLDISEIQCYWLTNIEGKGVLEPSLEKLNHFTESLISSEQGLLFIEGFEWLVSIHGFEAVHSMLRSLAEKVAMSRWSIYLSLYESSYNQQELSRIIREAPILEFKSNEMTIQNDGAETSHPHASTLEKTLEMDLNDDGTPKLVLLTKLPRSGFTKQILQRRILQWRRMGLDTSEIEASLYSNNLDAIYEEYSMVEEKVRRATELERYVVTNIRDTQERAIALFRLRQLTGLDQLEKQYFSE
ncbi:MAG TPA: DUF835 domain-containing protein [Candidatus Poseidoniaceae archaeon]|nr:MAG TPA: DUF835 domain-containing protein [Candidatus Poseidoniales archaeon]HII30844.1 DUF835 domain-containing protein [Candidatus Poseidoniaceae archaeon]